ncbi:stemmadenine O-acetyltransferase-like [Salvia hispanica]|uniref:stemmadenine O-acetyltransferase-like n=1 Tax=Salvia hispanica TaxID=49212 RepID=UPI002009C2D6|nr:stemmadenine O-acetyltransferase-like [Salvia hispanica]
MKMESETISKESIKPSSPSPNDNKTMKMEAEIISKEFIKPSSPTPNHKKTYNLSLLDQIVPPIYVPLVFYFPNPQNLSQITPQLQQSLSTTLSHFYPLAGRLKDSLSVDCNDEGIAFVVAKFAYSLSTFLRNPDAAASRCHIPTPLTWAEPGPGSPVAMAQLSHFACGGVAVGVLILHKVADGVAIGSFVKSWARATIAGLAPVPVAALAPPDYAAQLLFPHNESMRREEHLFSAMKRYFGFGKTTMRRYVFDAESISRLRARLSEQGTSRPTRVETVSAFLWKCFMTASAGGGGVSLVTHGVNMRRKSEPPLSENSFGNHVWLVPASSENGEADRDLKALFSKVREAIVKVDVEFVERMKGDVGFAGYCTNLEDSLSAFPEKADYLAISSWCNFGIYDVDFGWGRPVWVTKCDGGSDVEWPFINVLWLIDTREGDGVEAWLTLEQRCFEEFDKIKEVADFALIDPSPLEKFDKIKEVGDHALIDPSPLKKLDKIEEVGDHALIDPSPLEIIQTSVLSNGMVKS